MEIFYVRHYKNYKDSINNDKEMNHLRTYNWEYKKLPDNQYL